MNKLIRTYVWKGQATVSRGGAKVGWSSVTRAKQEGGINIIDIEEQCKALLFKIFHRMNMPGNQPWKLLLRHQLLKVIPDRLEHTRQNWEKDERWLFTEGTLKMPRPNTFSGKLFRLWKEFKSKMEKRKPTNTYELDRQPIFLNKLFQYKGKCLGETEDRGIDKVCRDLHSAGMRTFVEADSMIKVGDTEMNRDRLKAFYGLEISAHRLKKFETALEDAQGNCKQSIREARETTPAWWITEGKVVYTATKDQAKCFVFEVGVAGRLLPYKVPKESSRPDMTRAEPIRVIRIDKKTASIDPMVTEGQEARMYWFRQQKLSELAWDLVEWNWRGRQKEEFFAYETRLGRRLIRPRSDSLLVSRMKRANIQDKIQQAILKELWKGQWAAKTRYFMWLTMQDRLPSKWNIHLSDQACDKCGARETQRHILWECKSAQDVWRSTCWMLQQHSQRQVCLTYEAAVWGEAAAGMRNGTDSWKWAAIEEGAPRFDQLNTTRTDTEGIPTKIMDLLRGITMWEVWKARCNRIFNDREEGPRVVVARVWSRMITAAASRVLQLEKRGGRNGPKKAKKEAQIWHFLWKQGEAGDASRKTFGRQFTSNPPFRWYFHCRLL
ncbi:hypothetical protein SELMODRAFT_427756 [Selaginella moellendorffii]|uniref:Reverse transcriptase zinc-binding domain-containing protein n=1 Tax=Selaginella moellendorffii TaxID=88036 RepID=D8T0L8_SELML|nr:hypothetical protein SELMODRAFT_427756 [Selaginella moellendorffii]